MIIQKITKKDLLDIWLWRNDKMSIFFSKNRKEITLECHNKWFSKNLTNTKIISYKGILISKKGKIKKVGVVRFNIKNKYALVSINLNPTLRGKRLSYALLSGGIKKFLKFKKLKLIAEIKKNNLASIKCFLKNEFYFLKSRNQYNLYQKSLG
jgi:RimJ/RimL family protein N-acetyltransferase